MKNQVGGAYARLKKNSRLVLLTSLTDTSMLTNAYALNSKVQRSK